MLHPRVFISGEINLNKAIYVSDMIQVSISELRILLKDLAIVAWWDLNS